MTAELISLAERRETAFARCKSVISRGGAIVYPTDTFYGLGVDPGNGDAVRRLFAIKDRQPDQPILVLLSDAGQVRLWAESVSPEAERLMQRHWPGPLTLVFQARSTVLPLLTAGTGLIGLRVPGNILTRDLLTFIGTGLTGTSANRSGGENPRSAGRVLKDIGDRVDIVLDGGEAPGGKPSTVADVSGNRMRVIREGAVAL